MALQDAEIRAKSALVNIASPLPTVIGHPATVVLIISNYIAIALKFIPAGVRP